MGAITLTPLEALLISGSISFVSALAVRVWLGKRFVRRDECHAHLNALAEYKRDFKLIFAMLREIVLHLPKMSAAQRAHILNMKKPD